MPIRVYAVPTRNDLSDGLVQFNDVFPNTSQTSTLNPVGQTGYINPGFFTSNPAGFGPAVYEYPLGFGLPTVAAGVITNTGYVDGLAAWALDNLCGFVAGGADDGKALNVTQARSFAARVVCRAVKGQSLTTDDICACLAAVTAVASGPATSAYSTSLIAGGGGQIGLVGAGLQKTNAQMTEEVIKILSGQVYRMLVGAIVHDNAGPDMYTGVAHNPCLTAGAAAASGFLTAPNTNTTAAQTFPASADFVPFRNYFYGGEILASAQEGQLHEFATHQLGEHSFHFKAAKLADGQTAATYGAGSATGATAAGTARALQHPYTVTSISAANPAVVTFTGNHGFKVNDVIRLRDCVQAGTILTNGVYKVQAVGAATTCALKSVANVNVNNTGGGSGAGAGGTFTLEVSAPTAAVVTATDSVNIPATGSTAFEFRAIVVYDNEGNVLS